MARIVGQKKAREIWFLCRECSAKQALDMGLVKPGGLAGGSGKKKPSLVRDPAKQPDGAALPESCAERRL
ncbi:hypothetical protein ACLBR5_12610 [Escherichia coli]